MALAALGAVKSVANVGMKILVGKKHVKEYLIFSSRYPTLKKQEATLELCNWAILADCEGTPSVEATLQDKVNYLIKIGKEGC